MIRRIAFILLCCIAFVWTASAKTKSQPNFIFILADDLGYNDLGCYGQTLLKTPNLDRMAAEGIRFTSAYAGAPVCGPSRAVLLTGLHNGHSPLRHNPGQARGWDRTTQGDPPLPANIPTFGKVFKQAGYDTAIIGKWGMGRADAAGTPQSIGFDYFFGYDSHIAAHDYYPAFLWRNDQKVPLDGKTYTHDLFTEEASKYVREHKDHPFFLYLAYTIPHGPWNPPDLGRYADKPWSEPEKAYAAMVHRLDNDIGKLFALLKELKLDENTLVIFTSDNGPYPPSKSNVFKSDASFRGKKNTAYEGALRVPFIARWPGHVPAGQKSDLPIAFYDLLATSAEFVGSPAPADTDGISFLPTLLNQREKQKHHDYLYWEMAEADGGFQGIRLGKWKAERLHVSKREKTSFELYDLEKDPGQKQDVAAEHPDVVKRIEQIAREAHTSNAMFPLTLAEYKSAKPKGMTRDKKAKNKDE